MKFLKCTRLVAAPCYEDEKDTDSNHFAMDLVWGDPASGDQVCMCVHCMYVKCEDLYETRTCDTRRNMLWTSTGSLRAGAAAMLQILGARPSTTF